MVGPEGVSLGIRNEVITIKRYTIMKIEIINHQTGNQEIEVSRGIYFYDSRAINIDYLKISLENWKFSLQTEL